MPETLTTQPDTPPAPQPIRDMRRLCDDERALIWNLASAGKTQTEIAHIVGCHQSSVSEWLKKLTSTTKLAEIRANNLALKSVESLRRASLAGEKQGKHGAQAAILQIAGLLGAEGGNQGPRVVVQIGASDSTVQVHVIQPETTSPALLSDTFASDSQ